MKKKISTEHVHVILMLAVVLSCILTFAIIQPLGDGLDEINRFKVVEYIYEHGTLPHSSHL